jgi:hypothetical protein
MVMTAPESSTPCNFCKERYVHLTWCNFYKPPNDFDNTPLGGLEMTAPESPKCVHGIGRAFFCGDCACEAKNAYQAKMESPKQWPPKRWISVHYPESTSAIAWHFASDSPSTCEPWITEKQHNSEIEELRAKVKRLEEKLGAVTDWKDST